MVQGDMVGPIAAAIGDILAHRADQTGAVWLHRHGGLGQQARDGERATRSMAVIGGQGDAGLQQTRRGVHGVFAKGDGFGQGGDGQRHRDPSAPKWRMPEVAPAAPSASAVSVP